MLSLTRKVGQRVRLRAPDGTVVWVVLYEVESGGKARIAFDAPPGVEVLREELLPEGERYVQQA